MDNSIYEVTHDESYMEIDIFNLDKSKHFTKRIIDQRQGTEIKEKYYIFDLPSAEEYCPPVPTRKIVLTDRKQVQDFLNLISKIQKGEIHD